jgi:cell division protein FtsL
MEDADRLFLLYLIILNKHKIVTIKHDKRLSSIQKRACLAEKKGLGKGIFKNPVKCQKKLREE